MKFLLKIYFTTLTALILFNSPAMAEFVFLKDGSILTGKIESESPVAINFLANDGKKHILNPKNIMRILYTDLYMGKILINKIDGTVLEAYMVDEDQTSYTFRKDLYKPVEFTIKRDEVLFTARKNPVSLTGQAEGESISLKWKAPYTGASHYKVYIKSDKDYKSVSEPMSTSVTIRGLKSVTTYFIKVTAVDREGQESLPSNEIILTTKNIPPEPPKNVKIIKFLDKTKKNMHIKISWDKSKALDGTIIAYNVYREDPKKDTLLASVPYTEFPIYNLTPGKQDYYFVRSVDFRNVESKNSYRTSSGYDFKLGFQLMSIIPLYAFGNIHTVGFGFLINSEWQNVFFKNFNIGISVGYWELQGKSNLISSIDYSMMVPFFATVSYRIAPASFISIIPRIAIGYSINYVAYRVEPELYTGYGLDRISKTRIAFEPLMLAGFAVQWELSYRAYLNVGGDFGMIFERGGPLTFVGVSIEAGIRF